jgi:transcriptional regulator with XRE-family HTH domain
MATRSSPTLLRRQLAGELRRLRELAKRSVGEVAAEFGWSESKLSRIETAKSGIRAEDLRRLLATYRVKSDDRARLLNLANLARQRAWWEATGAPLPDAYETYIGFEAEAACISTYQALVVPGLIQTSEYAAALMYVDLSVAPNQMEQRVGVRMARQAVLTHTPQPQLDAILDEAVLRRAVGGSDVLRRQLLRLIEAGERPNIDIQVMPFSVGVHQGLAGSFVILDFEPDQGESIVYSEGMTGGILRQRREEVEAYRNSFSSLRQAALSVADSAAMIHDIAQGNR